MSANRCHIRFNEFFRASTGHEPFDYQCRLACGERRPESDDGSVDFPVRTDLNTSDDVWLSGGAACQSLIINIPTGLGKTAAVVLAWLFNRLKSPVEIANERAPSASGHQSSAIHQTPWPRRLVYCLPMRTLVEQTRDNVSLWLNNLAREYPQNEELQWLKEHSPVILMGGEELKLAKRDWDIWPEKPCIIIGTQDMLLSRALNRGYGMSRYRWPMHFGLLNNDCLWVFDEIQLMGCGLATTAQLEAFRARLDQNGCASLWMSATLQRDWLKTVDFADPSALPLVNLDYDDLQNRDVRERREARKPVQLAPPRMDDSNGLATEILNAHRCAGGRTLVVVNTVKRACELAQQLHRVINSAESKPEMVLIHSRFRPDDRCRQVNRLLAEPGEGGMIVVSTQVVEAGVDVSAATLFTELAPWASLVQRFGRCNRRGAENDKAQVFWIDLPADDKQHAKLFAPYQTAELLQSRKLLRQCQDVGPASLAQVNVTLPYQHGQVLRRKDFIELFDTTPDLAGNDIDIERYVREVDECDVQVFWRDWPAGPPPADMPGPRREELCAVPMGEFREFVNDNKRRKLACRWDYLDEQWLQVEPNRIFPGQVYLLHAEIGGYTAESGWDAKSSEKVEVLPAPQPAPPPEANDADPLSQSAWQSIAQHTQSVCRELEDILSKLEIAEAFSLKLAARWHDRGKTHAIFQEAVDDGQNGRRLRPVPWQGSRVVGKAPGRNKTTGDPGWWRRYERKHFRHELASALAVLIAGHDQIAEDARDLVAYLVAAHHGKVRLSIRSLPEETVPSGNRRFARGIWDNDELPPTDLGSSIIVQSVKLSLEPMELGLCEQPPFEEQPSWADRMLRLRDKLGPFRLAYLEAILRAADMRASALEIQS